ncbi:Fanconi anemia group D2 protein [Lamellibrachia satsuma]|nr:Fanconi anemia group D2 protein [Lamellibrachia satsuma]
MYVFSTVTANYVPPPANFDGEEGGKPPHPTTAAVKRKPKVKGKKRKAGKKSEDQADESKAESDEDTCTKASTQNESELVTSVEMEEGAVVNLDLYSLYLRELDMDVFNMLHVGLITKAALDSDMNTKDTSVLQLQPPQLEFLLRDLVHKLEHVLVTTTTKRRSFLKTKSEKRSGFSHLDDLGAPQVVAMVVQLLPDLCDHLEGASAFFQTLIAANDGLIDGPGSHTTEAHLMGSCFHLLLDALLALFSWTGFVLTDHQDLLRNAVGTLAGRMNMTPVSSQMSLAGMIQQSVAYLENFSCSLPLLSSAIVLCRLLSCLAQYGDRQQLSRKIACVSEDFLKREWLDRDGQTLKGARHNEHTQALLKLYLNNSDDVLGSLEKLTAVGVPELLEETDKNAHSTTYPTLTKNSYPVFYRVMLHELVATVKMFPPDRQTDTEEVQVEKLLQWNLSVRIFHILVNLIKVFDARPNLGALIKYGRQFMELVVRLGMPLLDRMFRSHRENAQLLLKNLQLSTRSLHHLCGHSKIMKDIALTNQVPLLKKSLETFVYRVKAMLTMAQCLEAFWLGNLKNRDLRGEEILSQVSNGTDQSDSDDASVDEEEESEVEMDGESEAGSTTKASGINSGSSDDESSYSEIY